MNNPVLNLLLNLNGTLSRKSYCAAVILLFVIIGIVVSKVSVYLSSTVYGYSYSDISGPATFSTFKSLVWIFTPSFIPIYFIGFYSAVAITIKRSRALKLSTTTTFVLAVINSLFFNIFFKIQEIFQYIGTSAAGDAGIINLISPIYVYVFLSVFFVLGLLMNLYFLFNRQGGDDHRSIKLQLQNINKQNSYNQFAYLFYVAKLMLINLAVTLVLAILVFIFRDSLADMLHEKEGAITLGLLGVFYFGIFFGLFMHATAKRLNDAGYKTYLLVLYFIFVVIFCGVFAYIVILQTSFSLILIGLSTLFVNLFSAVQIIPFLLTSKDEK